MCPEHRPSIPQGEGRALDLFLLLAKALGRRLQGYPRSGQAVEVARAVCGQTTANLDIAGPVPLELARPADSADLGRDILRHHARLAVGEHPGLREEHAIGQAYSGHVADGEHSRVTGLEGCGVDGYPPRRVEEMALPHGPWRDMSRHAHEQVVRCLIDLEEDSARGWVYLEGDLLLVEFNAPLRQHLDKRQADGRSGDRHGLVLRRVDR